MTLKEKDYKIEEDGIWISKKALEEVRDYYREVRKEHAKGEALDWSAGVDLGKRDMLNDILKCFNENLIVTNKAVGSGIQSASKDMENNDHTFLHLQISEKLRELMPKIGDEIFVNDDFYVAFNNMNRGSVDEMGKVKMIYHSNIRDRFGNRFVCATTKGLIKISEMTTSELQRLNNILDKKKYSFSKVQIRNDIPETDIRQAERAAVTAVYMRITDSRARRFTDDQISDIRNYRAMFTDETSTTELYSQLFERALQRISFSCPEKWKSDALKELNDLADGITREESRGLHK